MVSLAGGARACDVVIPRRTKNRSPIARYVRQNCCASQVTSPLERTLLVACHTGNTFKRIAIRKGLNDIDKHMIFSGTAARVYRLPHISASKL
jgi:hypothetical protein